MQLLKPQQHRTQITIERDRDFKESIDRRNKIVSEIDQFNKRKYILTKSNLALEEEFNKFCLEMNNKRKYLLEEIKSLDDRKQELIHFIDKAEQIKNQYETSNITM